MSELMEPGGHAHTDSDLIRTSPGDIVGEFNSPSRSLWTSRLTADVLFSRSAFRPTRSVTPAAVKPCFRLGAHSEVGMPRSRFLAADHHLISGRLGLRWSSVIEGLLVDGRSVYLNGAFLVF